MKRSLFAGLFVVLALLLANAQPLVATARPESSAKKSKPVTRTFQRSAAITIPEIGVAAPYPSVIKVSGLKKGKVRDVNLTLRGFSHTFPADLDILLVAPNGRNATVMSDVGRDSPGGDSAPITNATLILDDQAAKPLPEIGRLTAGRFRPLNAVDGGIDQFPPPAPIAFLGPRLSTFNGIKANGTWQLFIVDDGNIDGGELARGWELKIETTAKGGGKGSRLRRNHEERPAADRPQSDAASADGPGGAAGGK